MNKDNSRLYIIFNILGVVLAITFNFLAVSLPINNKTTGELSDAFPNYFVPAGFTFSIWGIIYVLMIGFALFQLWKFQKKSAETTEIVNAISHWFFASCVANATWIIFWHYEKVALSLATMFFLLYSLIRLYQAVSSFRPMNFSNAVGIHLFISVYLGWISVATIANVTTMIISTGWQSNASVQGTWTIVMIIIAAILGIIMIFRKQDIPYALVIVWALWGIYSKRISFPEDVVSLQVATVAKYSMVMLSIYAILNLVGRRSYFFEHK
ncbi:MAG: tryptophan-rich sensory protein [Saprospiraceae bacterium]|nr:tryptophan-rich sensory protein [Saprospiraceae bacterium]